MNHNRAEVPSMNSPRRVPVLVALGLLVAAPVAHTRAIAPGCAISPILHLTVCDRNGQMLPIDTARSQAPLESGDPTLGATRQGMSIAGPPFSDVFADSAKHSTPPPDVPSRAGKRASIPASVAQRQLRSSMRSDVAKYPAYYAAVGHPSPLGKRGAEAYVATPIAGLIQAGDAREEAPRRAAPVPEPESLAFLGLGLLILATRRLLPWLMRGSSRWRARNVFVASAQRSFPSVYVDVYVDAAGNYVVGNAVSARSAPRIIAPVRALASNARMRRYVGGLR
jgi:hypothetical protein